MAEPAKPASGGGAATASGTTFQEDVAAYFSTLILAELSAEPPLGLPQGVFLTDVVAESSQPIDDLAIGTSAGGVLFLQSKTSLSLSELADSEFGKVLDQFVRQFTSGTRAPGKQQRPCDPARDRFALVVSHDAPATISEDLQAVLSKLRSGPSLARLSELPTVLNESEGRALRIVRAHVQRSWNATHNTSLTEENELRLLRLVHILPLDLRSDGADSNRAKDLLRGTILREPAWAPNAWRAIVSLCRTFGPNRTGGDLGYLRSQLEAMGVPLRSVTSFHDDIEALGKYTNERLLYLKRLSRMELAGKPIKIVRPIVEAARIFASEGDCAVIGEPGAGKSGCLHDLAGDLRQARADVVLLAADMVKASSPEELARDLGLASSHSLVDVLQNWSGDGLGYLVVDALDAARSGMSLHVLCEVLRQIRERAPRWRIVASIREYDLRTSPDVQGLFQGTPHDAFKDARFPRVRHLRITTLTDVELSQVTADNAPIATTLAAASESLAKLLRNPFNLSLLCKLLDHDVAQDELNRVQAQVGLLDLYWSRRVEHTDETARSLVLGAAVSLMVDARELHLPRLTLAKAVPAHAKIVDDLLSDGLLAEVPGRGATPSSTLGFAHNILFDYATHRLWLDGLSDQAIERLSKRENHDLLLAIRASIVMAFEHLWYSDPTHASFWDRSIAFEQSIEMRLIGKIIAAGVAAQEFRELEDCRVLLRRLTGSESPISRLVHFTIQAAITQHDGAPSTFPIAGPGARDWMALAAELCSRLAVAAWDVRTLLWAAIRSEAALTVDQATNANRAALALIRAGLSNAHQLPVVRAGLEMAAATIAVNAPDTAAAIREVLTPERVAMGGHEWLHPLTERLDVIAQADPQLALDVVDTAFTASGSRDDQVPMGGRILAISMNKHDMLGMARHDIGEVFPSIVKAQPDLAARALVRIIERTIETEHPQVASPTNVYRIPFRGKEAVIRPDASHIWTAGEHNRHEDWWKILHAFKQGLVQLAQQPHSQELDRVLDVLRDECEPAVIWNALLDAAAKSPSTLGIAVSELLVSPVVLGEIDTRKAAGDLINSGYEYFSKERRREIEAAILRLPGETRPELAEYAEHRRNRIAGCIPIALIESPELRDIRTRLEAAGGPPPNEPDFSISTSWGGGDDDWWLRRQGVKPESPANADLLALSKSIKAIPKSTPSDVLDVTRAAQHVPLLQRAVIAIKEGQEKSADVPLIQRVEDEVVDACERLASARGLRRDDDTYVFVRAILRQGSHSPRPEYRTEDDARWDKESAGWGSPSPRIDAATGLMRLAAAPDTVDDEILTDIERLARDRVPAVRYQVLSHATFLYRTAPALMWKLIEECCTSEPRAGILSHFCFNVLLRLPEQDYGQLEPLGRRLYRRVRHGLENSEVRRACANFYLRSALWHDDRRGTRYVGVFARRPFAFPVESNTLIDLCRGLLRFNDSAKGPDESKRVRQWAFSFLTRVVESVRDSAVRLRAKHHGVTYDKWGKEDIEQLRRLHQLAAR
jgi:hypothetical protein